MSRIDNAALRQLFLDARSHPEFDTRPVAREVLEELTGLALLTPSAFNQQPLRLVYVISPEAKARLDPAMNEGNRAKTMAAPVTAIVCWDMDFVDHLPEVWTLADVRHFYAAEEARRNSARLNALLQAGGLILAARALGLGVGPMAGFNRAMVQEIFLQGTVREVAFVMNLGWPKAPPAHPRLPRLAFDRVAEVL